MDLRKSLRPAARVAGIALAGVALAAVLLSAPLQAADSTRCAGKVNAHLASLPLSPDDVQSIRIIERVNIADDYGPDILGVDAWVRLNSCSGYVVVSMTKYCMVQSVYTTGDCSVADMPRY